MINQNVLALDLASNTGWAIKHRDGRITHGSQQTASKENKTQRWVNFRSWLNSVCQDNQIHVIMFEQIDNFAPMKRLDGSSFTSTSAILTYGGYRALLEHYCMLANIELIGFGIGEIKKHWTGKGNANKAAMLAQTIANGFMANNHDEADAIAILSLGLSENGISIGNKA